MPIAEPPVTSQQKAIVHVARQQLGLDAEDYRAMLKREAGVESAADLTQRGFERFMAAAAAAGFKSTSKRKPYGTRDYMATNRQVAYIRNLFWEWAERPSEEALNAFLERKFKISSVRFLTLERAPDVIGTLRRMVDRKRARAAAVPPPEAT
jgi:hypothetical protein